MPAFRARALSVVVLLVLVGAAPLVLNALNERSQASASATTPMASGTSDPLATASGTPIPSSPDARLILYDDAVAPGFTDGSFGYSSKNPCDTSVYYSAPCSYAITYTAWGALNFQIASGNLTTSGFTHLQYKLYPAGRVISDFGVTIVSTSGRTLKSIVLSSRNTTSLSDGWLRVSIATSRLNPSTVPIGAIQLKNAVDATLPVVHYDDVMLTGGDGGTNPLLTAVPATPISTPTPLSLPPARATLPGQEIWPGGVSSFLFGSNDSEEWSPDNVETDPHHIIQPSMRAAHFTLARTFVFHYSLRDGHRTTIGMRPRTWLRPKHRHEYDRPSPPPGLYTGSGYEVERRIKTIENVGAHCLVTFNDIWTTPRHNVDPNPFHKRIVDPDTGKLETDLDFARKVVAYLGNRCNLYEIGNEPDLDTYTENGLQISHMPVATYVERWTEFVRALRRINPEARFIGPVTYNAQGNDCSYGSGTPYPSSRPGDCYLQNFLHGVKGTDVEPDAVSFHWYPCSGATLASCTPDQWNSYAQVTNQVRGWVRQDLGHLVPVGITEWNFDPGANATLASDGIFMQQFTRAALGSMVSARLDFAAQFDTQSFGGYGALDMFDAGNADTPKAQYFAVKSVIGQYRPTARGERPPSARKRITTP